MSEIRNPFQSPGNNAEKIELVFASESKERTLNNEKYSLHIILFIGTFLSTIFAGVFWAGKDPLELSNFSAGITYAVLIMLIISTHEFGHYIAARIHRIPVTLPYYIPFPLLFLNPFGTMGAVIRMKAHRYSRKALFDIGVAGPIAGWVTSLAILIIGFLTLPSLDYLYSVHPNYTLTGIPIEGITFGNSLLFLLLENVLVPANKFMPPMNEIYHYPFLCTGWFGLLITSLNMMPIGQLDGGHISYTMFGRKHVYIARFFFTLLLFFGIAGTIPFFEEWLGINLLGISPLLDWYIEFGSLSWMLWAVLIFFLIKVRHPQTLDSRNEPLGTGRMLTGYFSFVIFIVSFCPRLIYQA